MKVTFEYGTPYLTRCYEWDCLEYATWTMLEDEIHRALLCSKCKEYRESRLKLKVDRAG